MHSVDYAAAAEELLETEFSGVEAAFLKEAFPNIEDILVRPMERIFQSRTQAYREVLLGCVLVRIQDKSVDVHKPYVNQGTDAYNGRTLDERVVNPFLHKKRIPSSQGPFLSTFRRSVKFDRSTRAGLRDKEGYDALHLLVDYLATEENQEKLLSFFRHLLFCFIKLRSDSEIPLSRIQRISIEQYDKLITGLLNTASGGRFPVMLVEAIFHTINEEFDLGWTVESQGINVADRPSGSGGDVTVRRAGEILLVSEITERPVDKNRVISTFHTKIAPHSIDDYLFFVTSDVKDEARVQARQYFSQGHEVNFLEIKNWILAILATVGKRGRKLFNRLLTDRLDDSEVPAALKIAWNDQIAQITTA